jgi:hypothetical protein
MTPSFSKAAHKKLKQLTHKNAEHCKAGLIALLAQQTRKAPVRPMKKARLAEEQQQRLSKKEETARIRETCMERANGFCERPGCSGAPQELDHWLHGIGRRRQRQSVATCWMLCSLCHRYRTENWPNADFWNALFAEHCRKYGYAFTGHITHAPLPKSSTALASRLATTPPGEQAGAGAVEIQKQLSEKEQDHAEV